MACLSPAAPCICSNCGLWNPVTCTTANCIQKGRACSLVTRAGEAPAVLSFKVRPPWKQQLQYSWRARGQLIQTGQRNDSDFMSKLRVNSLSAWHTTQSCMFWSRSNFLCEGPDSLRFAGHIRSYLLSLSLCSTHPFKNVKTILSSQQQAQDQIWPRGRAAFS